MTLPFNPVRGDVLTENNGTEWVIVQEFFDPDTDSAVYWAKTETSPVQYRTILLADRSKFTKKEPIFEEIGRAHV